MAIKTEKFRVRVVREIGGEWVRVGETYTVTRRLQPKRHADAHFLNEVRGSGTFMRNWKLDEEIASGAIVRI